MCTASGAGVAGELVEGVGEGVVERVWAGPVTVTVPFGFPAPEEQALNSKLTNAIDAIIAATA